MNNADEPFEYVINKVCLELVNYKPTLQRKTAIVNFEIHYENGKK